jgi:hypothetical protein
MRVEGTVEYGAVGAESEFRPGDAAGFVKNVYEDPADPRQGIGRN